MSSVDWAAVDTLAADLVKIESGNNLENREGAVAWMEAQRQTRDAITAAIRECQYVYSHGGLDESR